jgi:hypothetical protein
MTARPRPRHARPIIAWRRQPHTSYTSATFADKNIGTTKTVAVSGISISGADAANYSANTTASTMADITARSLHVQRTGTNKVYDGTTSATVTLSDDRLAGDTLTTSYTTPALLPNRRHCQDRERQRHQRDGNRRGQLHLSTHRQRHRQHHRPLAERNGHREQQGL